MEPAVDLRGAVALVGRFPALAGADLTIAPGEVVLLQGPNGAGKTTLLRCCAGLVPVVEGTARVLGCDLVADPRAVRRRVGLLAHATGLYDDLTVEDNVRFWGRASGARDVDVAAALDRLGLAERLRHVEVGRLSAGQRRRTSLAVLVARRPELWLLDEPHAGLDQAGRDLVDGLIGDASRAGATVLLSSHELERAARVAHRQVEVVGGHIRDASAHDLDDARERGDEGDDDVACARSSSPARTSSSRPARVTLNQVAPFAVLVLLLFATAFDSSTTILRDGTPGLFWIAVLLSGLLAVQRAFSLEAPDGLRDALRLSGLHPGGIFLGKVASVSLQLLVLDALLLLGVVALYDARLGAPALLVPSVVAGTVGLAAVGCVYGILSVGQRVAATLLPLLMLPALAPLLLAATQAVDAALGGTSGEGWRWLLLVVGFAAAYLGVGTATFGILLDDG